VHPPNPNLAPLSRRSLADDATSRIRRAIISGELAPGHALPETSLAGQLAVSRVPIREALVALEQEGLVEFDCHGRSRVRLFSEADFEDLFSMRCTLEVMAARLLAKRLNSSIRADLQALLDRQESTPDLTELSHLDVEFHERIILATNHRPLAVCWKTIRSQIEFWLARAHRAQAAQHLSSIELTVPGHRRLLTELCSGNETRAEKAMRTEMATWREWLPA
jgi:DNA-binding GntR family transcriptional regulator